MTQQEKEKALIDAANKYSLEKMSTILSGTKEYFKHEKRINFIDGAKSDVAKQYHSEPPMELEGLKKLFDNYCDKRRFDLITSERIDIFEIFRPHLKPVESEWISVENQLPENRETVLIYWEYDSSMRITSGSWCNSEYWQSGAATQMKVTHWMPLPNPPKK